MVRFVALGDSLTEGVGDPHPAYPNGWRGWAELVADALERRHPGSDYVNLALRGRRARQVLDDQVDAAVALHPDLVTLWAGGNDLLLPRVSVDDVAATIGEGVDRLRGAGARVLLLTTFEMAPSRALRQGRVRAAALNDRLRLLAEAREVTLVDVADVGRWGRDAFAPDRVHLNAWGHRLVGQRVADVLGLGALPGGWRDAIPSERSIPPAWAGEAAWWTASVVPHVWRWATAAGSRERALPKWPEPVRPSDRLQPSR